MKSKQVISYYYNTLDLPTVNSIAGTRRNGNKQKQKLVQIASRGKNKLNRLTRPVLHQEAPHEKQAVVDIAVYLKNAENSEKNTA